MDAEKFAQTMLDSTEVFGSQAEAKRAQDQLLGLAVAKTDWVADDQETTCQLCSKEFTFFFRRHHCRYCGKLVCNDCTKARLAKQRICIDCNKTYINNAESNAWLSKIK